ncbi:MAG: sigma-70 family RNA polymerase sigma factor [Kineosporiaceae bacterium]
MTQTTPAPVEFESPEALAAAAQRYRRELLAHCYRMTGCLHEAEDLVQETYLRAWRAAETFQGRSSMRTWLYRIATNACLTALDGRKRRPLPSGLGGPASDPANELSTQDLSWLEPIPDALVGLGQGTALDAEDPADRAVHRSTVRLALIAALQHLTPQQRAVLVLRDVLAWRAAEVATVLDTSVAAVNSLLQRARAQLASVSPREEEASEPESPQLRELLDTYVSAFERYDVPAIVDLLHADAVWEMPPFDSWFQGAENIGGLISRHCPASGPGDQRLLPTTANGQPAFGLYMRGEDGVHRAFHLQVLDVDDAGKVRHVVAFFDTSLFARFGLPEVL